MKFTAEGGDGNIAARRLDDHAVLTVADTGIGIAPEVQPHPFTRFFRSSTATQQAIQGTGLGLVIVRNIIDQHGGTIRIDSTPGRGTTVTVRLPLAGTVAAG